MRNILEQTDERVALAELILARLDPKMKRSGNPGWQKSKSG